MSDMSMFVLGLGLEAFDDVSARGDYQHPVIDGIELETAAHELANAGAHITENTQRVVALNDARVYGEGIRSTLTEAAACELQRRVMVAVGEDRATLVVGSVENYNGSLGEQLLNAGLESVGNILRTVLETLAKLIRTGVKMLFSYLTSAKAVLGRQLRAVAELTGVVKLKLEDWEEFQISIGGGNATVVHGKSGTLGSVGVEPVQPVEPVYVARQISLDPANARLLSKTQSNVLRFSDDVVADLKETMLQLGGVVKGTLFGLDQQDNGIMNMIIEAARTPEPDDVNPFIGLVVENCYPVSKMITTRASNEFNVHLESAVLLGDYQLKISAPPTAVYKATAKRATSAESARAMANLDVSFTCQQPTSAAKYSTVTSLSRDQAIKALDLTEFMIEAIISQNDTLTKNLRSYNYDQALNKLYSFQSGKYADPEYVTLLTQAMRHLSNAGDVLTPQVTGYVNRLSNAVRQYVAVSAQL